MNSPTNTWQKVRLIKSEQIASDVKSLTFKLKKPTTFLAGQHYSIRINIKKDYIAERDYSLANPPEVNDQVEFGIQLIKDGEVSPFLYILKPNDQIEIKGPTGRSFFWEAHKNTNPLLLVSGGAGLVPLRSMILHHINNYKKREVVLLISFKSIERVLYQKELEKLTKQYPDFKIVYTYTQKAPDKFSGYQRRVDQQMIADVFAEYKNKNPSVFVCGPTPFVEVATNALIAVGFDPQKIKAERFG